MSASRISLVVLILFSLSVLATGEDLAGKKKKKKRDAERDDPYAEYVWPPPPDKARIKLDAVIAGRADVEARSKFWRNLVATADQTSYDHLKKPYAVAIDSKRRVYVTDSGNSALVRFDRENRVMDVFGTTGPHTLKLPLGLHIGPDGTIFVADAEARRVVGYNDEGETVAAFGGHDALINPADSVLSPDGKRLYVADSKAHQIVVFDRESADEVDRFGERGVEAGEFNFPTSLAIGPEGQLFVVDQLNCRIQVFEPDGEYLDEFGERGTTTGSFARPKDIAVDEVGFIYVTDALFNNVQLFDADFSLLTFVGQGGREPGQFFAASGIAVLGDDLAVVDQVGARLQLFRYIVPKDE
jgi:DNA-binding beta-propeller fold protein YncE